MIVLAIDTCDSRGSVALLREGVVLASAEHDSAGEYSAWLLPAVEGVLKKAGVGMSNVEAYGVASGPGSFTGVRVGLTTVKAWGEVYGKPLVAVSRLEAMASQAVTDAAYVAAFANAQRGQVFGAVYRRKGDGLERLGDEMVIAAGKFVETAGELVQGGQIAWVSPDAAHLVVEAAWKDRERRGETVKSVSGYLAPVIGRMAASEVAAGRFTDALALDANYVRRSDAEIFWKGGAAHGR